MKLENNLEKYFYFDFTIITVVKNDEKNIENTIKSVLSQKKVKVQYIVLDGYSNDNTFKIIKKYKKKLRILRYKDKSFYDGLNHALDYAEGRYIGILNSGDLYFNENILENINQKKKSNNFIFGNVLYYNEKYNIVRDWNLNFNNKKNLYFFYIAHSSLFISFDIMKNYLKSYNLNYKIASDTDLIIRLNLVKNIKYKKIDKYFVFMKTGGLSTNFKLALKKFFEDIKILKNYFKSYFFVMYLKKILLKFKGLIISKKKKELKNHLLKVIKNLNEL